MNNRFSRLIAPSLLLSTACLFTLTGCETLQGDQSMVSRDVYDMKNKLNEYLEKQESTDRQTLYALNTTRENVEAQGEVIKNRLSDIEKRMRDQMEEMNQMRAQIEDLSFTIDTLSKRLGMGGVGSGSGSSTSSGGNSGFFQGGAATSSGEGSSSSTQQNTTEQSSSGNSIGSSASETMSRGLNQYNLGNFAEATRLFQQALNQNPAAEDRVNLLYWLAEANRQQNNTEAAQRYYTQLIEESPSDSKAWVSLERLANIYLAQGDQEYAELMLEQIVNNYPQYPDIERVRQTLNNLRQNGNTN